MPAQPIKSSKDIANFFSYLATWLLFGAGATQDIILIHSRRRRLGCEAFLLRQGGHQIKLVETTGSGRSHRTSVFIVLMVGWGPSAIADEEDKTEGIRYCHADVTGHSPTSPVSVGHGS